MNKIFVCIATKGKGIKQKLYMKAFKSIKCCNKYISRLPYKLSELGLYEMEYDNKKS